MRIMGIDYGDKNVGIAISDPTFLLATGVEIIRRENEVSIKKTIKRIEELIKEYEVCKIVLGMPKNMDGTIGFRGEKTIEFKERLNRNFKKIEVVYWDERLSTIGATRNLNEAGMNKQKQKEVIDKMAAVFILQGYLDYLNNNK